MDKKLLTTTLRNATLATLYVLLVSQFMAHASQWFGKEDGPLTGFAAMMLFSFSAAVMGGLVFGQSAILLFQNKWEEAVRVAIYTIGCLGAYTVLALVLMAVIK